MDYFMEASLSDSGMFQQLNASSSLMSKIAQAIKNGVALDKSYFETQYLQITKTRISPLADTVLKAFDEEKIRLIYNKNDHVTVALPFVVLNIGGKACANIFINEFSSMTNADTPQLTIEMKRLYTLMESAFIGLVFFSKPAYFTRNSTFVKALTNIYTQMVLRILNREYALSLTKDLYDATNYYTSRFFLERILGVTNKEIVNSYAAGNCNNPSETTIALCNNLYSSAKIVTIEDFINFIAKSNTKMNNLKLRYFFQRWASSYGTGATLSIDSFPYFYYCIANVVLGGFLVNTTAISDFVKNTKGINSIYPELLRIID